MGMWEDMGMWGTLWAGAGESVKWVRQAILSALQAHCSRAQRQFALPIRSPACDLRMKKGERFAPLLRLVYSVSPGFRPRSPRSRWCAWQGVRAGVPE